MEPTYVSFQPGPTQAFSFQATLDGQQYLVVITWSLFGQRYYLNVLTLQGVAVVVNYPMVGSPPWANINLLGPWFDTEMIWRPDLGQLVINPAVPVIMAP